MTLPNEILLRLQEGRKPNPNSPKKIIYFVGPPAYRKTSKVKTLKNNFGGYYHYITLHGYSSIWEHETNSFFRNLVDLLIISERLVNAIQTATQTHQNTIFVNGHPILSSIIYDIYKEIVDYFNTNKIFKDFQQYIYYINFPFEENLRLLQKKESCNDISEDMKTKLGRFFHDFLTSFLLKKKFFKF